MATSEEVIKYMSSKIDKENYISMFAAGSTPEYLTPKSDLDIIFVIKGWRKNNFFNNTQKVLDNFIRRDNSVKYSFFRGPLKYKHKGLIHVIVYTQEKTSNFSRREEFVGESLPVLKSLLKKSKLVKGASMNSLLKGVDLENKKIMKKDFGNMNNKFKKLIKNGTYSYRQWKKVGNEWVYKRVYKRPAKFFKEELLKYYSKTITL